MPRSLWDLLDDGGRRRGRGRGRGRAEDALCDFQRLDARALVHVQQREVVGRVLHFLPALLGFFAGFGLPFCEPLFGFALAVVESGIRLAC